MAGFEGHRGSSWGTGGGGACDFLRRRYSFLDRETDREREIERSFKMRYLPRVR